MNFCTHLVKDGKYRTPSMFNPALEDDLVQGIL